MNNQILHSRLKLAILVAAAVIVSMAPYTGSALLRAADAAAESAEDPDTMIRRAQAEKAQAEAEKAKAEAEKAKAEAEKAQIEAEQARRNAAAPEPRKTDAGASSADPDEQSAQARREQERQRERHRHLGLYLGIAMGFGGGGYRLAGGGAYLDGEHDAFPSFGVNLSLGGAIQENLILHVTTTAIGDVGSRDERNGYSPGIAGLNFGVTWYAMPWNIFVSGSAGPVFDDIVIDKYVGDGGWVYVDARGLGFNIEVKAGKEWWVSDNWGLGIGVWASYAYLGCDKLDMDIHQGQAAFIFSATYN